MRSAPAVLALLLAGCGVGQPAVPRPVARPLKVMSVNQCADQLVLALLPPERIASVTWLSRDPATSLMARQAGTVAINHGSAEEVLDQRPDLVIAGIYTTPALRGMLRQIGYPMLEVGHAGTVEDIRRNLRQIAAAVGEQARGEALIAEMDRKLAALARDPAPPVRVAAWDRTGFAAGEGTVYGAILNLAGARDVAPPGYRRPDLELLLQADPALLVQGAISEAPSLGDDVERHPLVRQRWQGRTLQVRQAYYVCGTPGIADAAIRLRGQLRAAARAGGRS